MSSTADVVLSCRDGEPFTATNELENAEYQIIEIGQDNLTIHDEPVEPECPELEYNSREELEEFYIHREDDGFCTAFETHCVLLTEQ